MAALRVRGDTLRRKYRDETRTLLRITTRLPGRPTSDDIHDLRVAARRTQVIRRLLPRPVRESQASKGFNLALKSILRGTSQLRDLDTLMDTLRAHNANLPSELLVNLENQRSDAAARAKAVSSVVIDTPVPDLEPPRIRGKKLTRRLRKRAKRRSKTVSRLLAEVLNDEARVEELHTLRKEVKKLRYLLELSDGSSSDLPALTRVQDSLGAIHDLDVAVSYLERSHFTSKEKAIRELRTARHSNYLRFVRSYREPFSEPLGDGLKQLFPGASGISAY